MVRCRPINRTLDYGLAYPCFEIWGQSHAPTVHSPTSRTSHVPRTALAELPFLPVDEVIPGSMVHNTDRWTEV